MVAELCGWQKAGCIACERSGWDSVEIEELVATELRTRESSSQSINQKRFIRMWSISASHKVNPRVSYINS